MRGLAVHHNSRNWECSCVKWKPSIASAAHGYRTFGTPMQSNNLPYAWICSALVYCYARSNAGRTLSSGSACSRNQAATAWPASWNATVRRSSTLITCVQRVLRL